MKVLPHYREGRKKPYEARWWVNQRPRSKFFATEKECDRFIRDFTKEIAQHGSEVFKFDKNHMRRWQEVTRLLPAVDPLDLARHWIATHQDVACMAMSDSVTRYFKALELAGRSKDYRAHVVKSLNRFCGEYGDLTINAITSEQISGHIHGLPFSPTTKRHARSYLAAAFKWFVKQGWISRNPTAAVSIPKVELSEPGILTAKETQWLFRTNEKIDPAICGLLALGAFAGMRSSAIERIQYQELDFSNRAILTPAYKTKKGRRHYIEELPDNLWAWLERAPLEAFQMSPRQIRHRRALALQRAGLLITKPEAKKRGTQPKTPPKNYLRHSFVSYHVALHRDPGKTALLISHKNQNVLWDHYLGVATKEDGERYFKISPTR